MELKAQKRSTTGKGVRTLREEGRMPAVVYGAKEESLPIEVDAKAFGKVLKEAGESTVVAIDIDGDTKNVLIHDVDLDPVTDEPRHADFYVVVKGQKVVVEVPLEFIGEAPAVKEHGANVIKVLHELSVEAEAANLPHGIEVDIASLVNLDDSISAKDIVLPAGVTLETDPDEAVVTLAVQEEESEEPVEGPDMDAIGISEERGKKEDEGASKEEEEKKED